MCKCKRISIIFFVLSVLIIAGMAFYAVKQSKAYRDAFFTKFDFQPVEGYEAELMVCAATGQVIGELQMDDTIRKSWQFRGNNARYDVHGMSFASKDALHEYLHQHAIWFKGKCP